MNIEKNYSLPYSVSIVYSAWISSRTVIPPASKMLIEPKIGGIYRLIVETDENISVNQGKFLEIETNKFLKYTWEWNGDGEISNIKVKFDGAMNETHIHLIHSGLHSRQSVLMHDKGWDSYIAGLELFLTDDC